MFPATWQTMRLRSVSSRYQNGNLGLQNLNLTIEKGEHIGIIGTSGSGKSTLAKILMGIIPINSGDYYIGDTELASIKRDSRTASMSIVLQDSELFNQSLSDNITAMRDIPEKRLAKAIQISALEGVIKKLPSGINEMIGERGYRVSGGERQRIGIARATCRSPEILILDEATSALDNKTEQMIHQSLIEDLKDKTVIIIAHRLSTLESVDRVVVMEHGTILEEGRPEQILPKYNKKHDLAV